jgi:hypothetical protein
MGCQEKALERQIDALEDQEDRATDGVKKAQSRGKTLRLKDEFEVRRCAKDARATVGRLSFLKA